MFSSAKFWYKAQSLTPHDSDVGSKTRLPAVKARKWKLEVCIPIIIKATMQIYLMDERALSSFLRVVSGGFVCDTFCGMEYACLFFWEILIQSSISNTWWFWDAGSDFPCPTWKQEVKSRCVYPSSWGNNWLCVIPFSDCAVNENCAPFLNEIWISKSWRVLHLTSWLYFTSFLLY
jgi:hypothetical protein